MREPEGIETPLPGRSSERTWSKHLEPDIRNVEAEGSSPFTSTKSPGQRAKVGSRKKIRFPTVSLRVFIGHMTSGSAPRGGLIIRVPVSGTRQESLRHQVGAEGSAPSMSDAIAHAAITPSPAHGAMGSERRSGGGLDGQSGSHGGDLFEVTALT